MTRIVGPIRQAALAALVAGVAACVNVPRQTDSMKRAGIEQITASQLRDIVLAYADGFIRTVETTADSIAAATDDALVRRSALAWKAASVHNIREAALVSDPLLGLVDAWLFTVQVRMFLESPPPGRAVFSGEYADALLAPVRREEARIRRIAVDVAGADRVDAFEPGLLEFAAEHPIDPLTLTRMSVLAADSALLRPMGGGLGSTLAATTWSMRELDDRLTSMDATLGKELRWNMQLLAYDIADLPVVDTALTGILRSLERITALTDTIPALVSGERAAVLEALHVELATLTAAIDDMRRETLDAVSGERGAVLDAVTRERLALLEAVTRERIATLASVDSMLMRAIDRSERLVDHIFWRMLQLGGAVVAVLIVAAWLLLRRLRPTIGGAH
jgi:hypothetical protein